MDKKRIIGNKELVSILDFELFDLDAKVDTGADSNALHCDDIRIDEENFVHFRLVDDVHPSYHDKELKIPLYKLKRVKSSNGVVEERPSVKVKVKIFDKEYKTVVSLTNRADMKYPMLLGRKFLSGKFLVDVSKEYITKEISE